MGDPDLEVDMGAITTEWEGSMVVVMTITGKTMVATITEEAMATTTMEWEEITVIATVWKIIIIEIMEILEAMVITIMEWTIMVWITMEEGMEILVMETLMVGLPICLQMIIHMRKNNHILT